MSKSIGIDLGSAKYCVATADQNGRVTTVLSRSNAPVTPAAVARNKDGRWIVGERALYMRRDQPQAVITDPLGKLARNPQIAVGDQEYPAADVLTALFSKIKGDAESRLGEAIDTAVIALDDAMARAEPASIIDPAMAAGLPVSMVVPSSVAIAVCRRQEIVAEGVQLLLVLDLGASALKATLLLLTGERLAYLAHRGWPRAGGKEFTKLLVDHALKELQAQHGGAPSTDQSLVFKLERQAERAKRELDTAELSYIVVVGAFKAPNGQMIDIELDIARPLYEAMIGPMIEGALGQATEMLGTLGLAPESPDHVLLAGAASKTPLFRRMVADHFGSARVITDEDSQESTARGAALLAQMGSLDEILEYPPDPRSLLDEKYRQESQAGVQEHSSQEAEGPLQAQEQPGEARQVPAQVEEEPGQADEEPASQPAAEAAPPPTVEADEPAGSEAGGDSDREQQPEEQGPLQAAGPEAAASHAEEEPAAREEAQPQEPQEGADQAARPEPAQQAPEPEAPVPTAEAAEPASPERDEASQPHGADVGSRQRQPAQPARPATADLPGYRLVRSVGRDTHWQMYLAQSRETGHPVRIRLYQADQERSKTAFARALVAYHLRHPSVEPILDFGGAGEVLFLVTPGEDRQSLRELLRDLGHRLPLPLRQALQIGIGIGEALEIVHRLGILHRNIKPENVIVDARSNRTLIGGFEMSALLAPGGCSTGVAGTLPYMSREAVLGKADFKADLYSVAVIIYEMVTGRLPFWATSLEGIKSQIVGRQPVEPIRLNRAVPPELNALIMGGLEKDPQRRALPLERLRTVLARGPNV